MPYYDDMLMSSISIRRVIVEQAQKLNIPFWVLAEGVNVNPDRFIKYYLNSRSENAIHVTSQSGMTQEKIKQICQWLGVELRVTVVLKDTTYNKEEAINEIRQCVRKEIRDRVIKETEPATRTGGTDWEISDDVD